MNNEMDKKNEELAQKMRWAKENYWTSTRYQKLPWDDEREKRMQWFREARLGMIIHFGLYSVLERNEWAYNRDRIPRADYDALADQFQPRPGCCEEWVACAAKAGMRYAVLTTKHHDGFCLWDTKQTDFNSVLHGPKRDLIKEFVEACRKHGIKVGLYYSLMDWHHPDGYQCKNDDSARERFLEFTNGCIDELCRNYGKIDIFWFDVPAPLPPEKWEAEEMITRIRKMQPGIIVNDRTGLPADYATPEEGVVIAEPGRDWEAAMTFNHVWGYAKAADQDYRSVRDVIKLILQVSAHGGNLLLNIGPKPDGSVPDMSRERLEIVGDWLSRNGEAAFGALERVEYYSLPRNWTGDWTAWGNTLYYWNKWWQGEELIIANLTTLPSSITLLTTGEKVRFRVEENRIVLEGLSQECPEPATGYSVFKMEFDERPEGRTMMHPEQ
ncbi:MAG: alpha-L-fucosidase [bacterium]